MKKILLFFAITMMAITASAKVYEADLTGQFMIMGGESKTFNGVVISAVMGDIMAGMSGTPGSDWFGSDDKAFRISTENGETMTKIEITAKNINDLRGDGWTKTSPGAVWTGSATSVDVGGFFEGVTKVTVWVEEKPAILTYNVADQGGLGVKVEKGEVTLNVTAEECWAVATLTVNEVDKLADLAEGKLTFDMQDDATVAVSYKWADEENLYTESDITTGIITTKADVKAYAKDGSIYVESNGAAITLYTVNGAKIAQKTPAMKTAIFTVPAGAYIVKVGSEGIKLVVE